jgi:hypothetical protein
MSRKFGYTLIERSTIPETLLEMQGRLDELGSKLKGFNLDFMMPYNEMRPDFQYPQGRLVMVLMIVYSYDAEGGNVVTLERYLDETDGQ